MRPLRHALAIALCLCAAACRGRPAPTAPAPARPRGADERNVVLVTLDGVRWQEFFGGADPALCAEEPARSSPECARGAEPLFPNVRGDLGRRGLTWGAPGSGTEASVANRAFLSLPAYQSILAGEVTPCADNACPRVGVETVAERVVRELGVGPDQAATVASWERMLLAAERVPGRTLVNAGLMPMLDPAVTTPAGRAELDTINARQAADRPPWGAARGDWWTMMQALRHLRDRRPRFLFLALNDADEWGHLGNYPRYLATLRLYDEWVRRVRLVLDGMGDYGRHATVLVTTDHGRGDGPRWRDHGPDTPEARRIWLFALPPGEREGLAVRTRAVTHLDIRPTVEAILGMQPRSCDGCGRPIAEVVEAAR